MTSAPGRRAAGVAEAAWLAALVVAPLYVEVAAQHPFEPTKAAAVRILAVIAAAAFAVDAIGRIGRSVGRERGADGIDGATLTWIAAAGLLALVQVVSTVGSLAPATSLFGSVHRAQGLTTLLAYVTLGVVAAMSIRRREQVDRALTCAIVAAIPVAIAAIAEHHGWMLLPRETPPPRAASTLGNPMALGGYLVLVVPLGVARVADAVRTVDPGRPLGWGFLTTIPVTGVVGASGWVLGGPIVGAAIAVAGTAAFAAWPGMHGTRVTRARLGWEIAVVGLLLGALVAAGSRGAAVGGAAGALVAVFVVGAPRVGGWTARRFTMVAVAAVGLIASGAVVVRLTGDRVPLLGRFNEPLQGPGSTVEVRTTLWRTAVDALRSRSPVRSASAEDGLHWLRPVIGHGPETTELALGPVAPAGLWQQEGRAAVPDRVHGGVLEAALQTGVLGLTAQLAVLTIAVVVGVRSCSSRRARALPLVGAWLVGGAAGVALALVAGRPELAGIALLAGMVGGLLVYLGLHRPPVDVVDGPVPTVVVVAALAGVIAHAIEVQFAFGWVTTSTYAWFALALIIAAGRPAEPTESTIHSDGHGAVDGRSVPGVFAGVALALVVHGLGHADRTALAWLVGMSVLGVVPLLRQQLRGSGGHDRTALLRASWSPAVAFIVTAVALVAAGRLAVGDGLIRFTPPIGWPAVVLVGLLVFIVLVTGTLLAPPRPTGPLRRRDSVTVVVAGLATVVLAWSLGVTPLQAELMRGRAYSTVDPVAAIELFERAQRTEPGGHRAAPTGVTLYLRAAQDTDLGDARGAALVGSGIALVESAHSRSPFDAQHALVLAELYEIQAELVPSDGERAALLDSAVEHQKDAVALRPASGHLRADLAAVVFRRVEVEDARGRGSGADERAMAERELRRAERLDPDLVLVSSVRARFAPTWSAAVSEAALALGRLADSGAPVRGVDRRARRLALDALERADSLATGEGSEERYLAELRRAAEVSGTADLYLALAEAHTRRGEADDGLVAIRTALELSPPDDVVTRAEYRRVEAVLGGGSPDEDRPVIDLRSD